MLPHALLFSSDELASATLLEILNELQVEVAHCREIFAAVEELTSRSFQIILIDWSQELEASFLFNMARELKCSRTTYTVVLADAQRASPPAVNPDGFLTKPFTANEAREVLLQTSPFRHLAVPSAQPVSRGNDCLEQKGVAPRRVDGMASARQSALLFSDDEPDQSSWPPALNSAGRRMGQGPHRAHGFIRPETSTAKKTLALVCLLVLLAAVLHGQRQLGYLPPGLFGYGKLTKALLPPSKDAIGFSSPARSEVDSENGTEFELIASNDVEHRNSGEAFTGRIYVRPVFGQGFSSLQKPTTPLTALLEAPASVETTESSRPSGANPLIPSSLYWSPHLASFYTGTAHSTFGQTRWSTVPIIIPEATSRALLVHEVLPSYPLEALRAGLQGTVVLQALVGRDGAVEDLKLVQGYFALGNAAISAVKQWRFRPYRLNGEIVEMQTLLTVSFPLNGDEAKRASSNGSLINYGAWK
jgi:TonB family protein